ncbi:DsbA family oxidoreductase [Meiothermus taiwanensis]|jgi:predicted DsbA family dithiol-disulfide isomerase|uniref:DSBA-like thioredoxin domain protein n=2 Tax=Meiothermus taiwanensis TaxID=172827 RepID=A0A399E0H5_9DEIN|nr:DsbA family protein [Meiothermus taiwanensis]AWR85416.1 DSBA oxidoreductase [Meiothermus taiwanensis WR-220]KIQ54005.1 DSBA oxidoreductase [Meiothermus taiwanensis]KZK15140.1 disulfide bond formation protein DsbA [Meiothermus taiwanensis]RIH78097.1 DSBA-like thioredoxin domain protein [Meiothermus taiwanensis]
MFQRVTVYLDYLCPFAWRGLELAYVVAPQLALDLEIRHYSLEQGNHPQNAGLPRHAPAWKLSEQPLESSRSLRAFLASHAARQQGKAAHLRFALELFRLHHQDKRELGDDETFVDAVSRAGLDLERFMADLEDEEDRRIELGRDLEEAGELGVFGTPTFVLPSGDAAYFRFTQLTTEPELAVNLWELFTAVLENGAHIETIRRPRR